jgi:hypothetical protein
MRKRQIIPTLPGAEPSNQTWLDMDRNVLVEVTSEEKEHPIESALLPEGLNASGWCSKMQKTYAPKSSSYDGHGVADILSEKSYDSNGILAHRTQYGRSRTTLLISPKWQYLS